MSAHKLCLKVIKVKLHTHTMAIFSKLGSACWETKLRNLWHIVLSVSSGCVSLCHVTQLFKVPNGAVCQLLDFIEQKQKLLTESYKDELV